MYLSITGNSDYIRNDASSMFIHTVMKRRLKIRERIVTHCIILEINILFLHSMYLLRPFTVSHDCTSGHAHLHTHAHKAALKTGIVSVLVLFNTNCILPSAFFAPLPVEALP